MKNAPTLLLLLLCFALLSQEKEIPLNRTINKAPPDNALEKNDTLNKLTAKQMAIYPGCKKFKKDKGKSAKCFNEKFNKDLVKYLNAFDLEEDSILIKLNFIIDTNGYLIFDEAKNKNRINNSYFKSFEENATQAFVQLSDKLNNKGGIKPALNKEDKPAVMKYSIPIKFNPSD